MDFQWVKGDVGICFADAAFIRTEVFVKEQGFANEFDETDRGAWHVVGYIDGRPAATARLYCEGAGGVFHIGRVAVLRLHRGGHIGSGVMREVMRKAASAGARRLVLSAQVQAGGFYKSLGFQPDGGVYLDEGCPHIEMALDLA